MSHTEETRLFQTLSKPDQVRDILQTVYRVLEEKGYDPVQQIVGYLLSGDPTYITREVRSMLRTMNRDDIIEELVRAYLRVEA